MFTFRHPSDSLHSSSFPRAELPRVCWGRSILSRESVSRLARPLPRVVTEVTEDVGAIVEEEGLEAMMEDTALEETVEDGEV